MGKYPEKEMGQSLQMLLAPEDIGYAINKPKNPKYLNRERDGSLQTTLEPGIGLKGGSFWSGGETLPGRGNLTVKKGKTHSSCGQELGFYTCPNKCVQTDKWVDNCSKAQCPVCFGRWIKRRSMESAKRLKKGGDLAKSPCKHIVLNPPPGWDENEDDLAEIRKTLRLVGGAIVRHPWRFYHAVTHEQVPWKWCDLNPLADSNITRENKKFHEGLSKYPAPVQHPVPCIAVESLHYHILGYGFLKKSDLFHQETNGWVYVNLGKREEKGIDSTLRYLISHTGIEGKKQTVRWVGFLANNKMKVTTEISYEPKMCETCGAELEKYQYSIHGTVRVENKRKVKTKYYAFR